MWLVTQEGFISVVDDSEHGNPDLMKVRARRREDLDRFREIYCPSLSETEVTPDRDYAVRGYCSREALAEAMLNVVFDIDYHNFKDRIHDRGEHQRANVYLSVWSAMLRLQEPRRVAQNALFDFRDPIPMRGHLFDPNEMTEEEINADEAAEPTELDDPMAWCPIHDSFAPCEHNGAILTVEGWLWPEDIVEDPDAYGVDDLEMDRALAKEEEREGSS